MSAETESGDIERAFVSPDECAAWRRRVHDGATIQDVAADTPEWSYTTVFEHIHENYSCGHAAAHTVPPVESQESSSYGIQEPSKDAFVAVRDGLRAALDANFGDYANIRIKSFRKARDIDVSGQRVGAVLRELAAGGDPRGEFVVEDGNPDSNAGWWMVRYADGGEQ